MLDICVNCRTIIEVVARSLNVAEYKAKSFQLYILFVTVEIRSLSM